MNEGLRAKETEREGRVDEGSVNWCYNKEREMWRTDERL